MKVLKKIWLYLVALMPLSAGAVTPLVIGGAALGVGIVGVSVWRSVSPVSISDALDFFTSCWTCQIFSDVMIVMSNLLPGVYKALGRIVIPMSVTLLVILIAWRLTSGFFNAKMDNSNKLLGNFGTYLVKMTIMISLLLMPLPRFLTSVLIEPALTLGTSLDYIVSDNNNFAECMVATALADPVVASADVTEYGAFSPKLRHQLACEVANVHQITGLGMTVGWTMLNMAFNADYMHKIFNSIPFFPNIPLFVVGLLILVLYFFALLPIPLYFLEIFIKLSLDLIMLPLMLMAWMFDEDGFAIFPKGGKTIRQMIDDVIKAIVGIGLTIIFLSFSVMFLNALFDNVDRINSLQYAIANNDSKIFMDGLLLRDSNLITVILIGLFLAMFMTMIPQLVDMLFSIKVPDGYYKTVKNDLGILWKDMKQIVTGKKDNKATNTADSGDGGGSSGGSGGGLGSLYTPNQTNKKQYTELEYIESTGTQYINTGINPADDIDVLIDVQVKSGITLTSGTDAFLFGAKDGQQNSAFGVAILYQNDPLSVYAEYGSVNGSGNMGYPITGSIMHLSFIDGAVIVNERGKSNNTHVVRLSKQSFATSWPMFLFGMNAHGIFTSSAPVRLYQCGIHRNNKTNDAIRLFIPVLDSDNIPCLYDIIEKKFYYNQGTGQFIAGPKKYK